MTCVLTAEWGWLGNTGNACEPNICCETQRALHTVFRKAVAPSVKLVLKEALREDIRKINTIY